MLVGVRVLRILGAQGELLLILKLLLIPLFGPCVVSIIAHIIIVGVDAVLQAARFRLAIRSLTQVLACTGELWLLQSASCVYLRCFPAALSCLDRTLTNLRPASVLVLLGSSMTALRAL